MPNRIIKESICTSDSIDKLSWFEEVLFYRLMVNCDDYGRYDGRPAIIKNKLFPLKENLTLKAVKEAINALASAELVTLYEFEGKPYLYLPTWNEHQNVRAKKSKYPEPDNGCKLSDSNGNTSENNCIQMYADVPVIQSNTKSNPNPIRNAEKRFTPPTLEEVKAYIAEKGYHVDAEFFWNYYDKGQWKRKDGTPVLNWKQTLVTWEKKDSDKPKKRQYVTAEEYKAPNTIDAEKIKKLEEQMARWQV